MKQEIPQFLYDMLLEQYGENITNKIIEGYSNQRKVTLRINTIKSNKDKIKEELNKTNIKFSEVDWYNDALIIENVRENEIKKLDIYENGEIYLQSLSSMLPPIILEPKSNENILDMAAAPGGKTTQIAAISNNETMITACEKNKIRAERLKYNLEKQGARRVNVMLEDARKLDDFFSFDKILLDAPCSGSGTIDISNINITKELVNRSAKTQEELLKKALKVLKKGKIMVYSTCSILHQENEDILKKVLVKSNAEIIPIDSKLFKNIPLLPVKIDGTICVCPNELYEGFFVCKIQKK